MAGLMNIFRRHSGILTNFRIYSSESRPIWLQEPVSECEEPRCAEVPAGGWSAWVDAEAASRALVGPWQYRTGPLGSTPGIPSWYPPGIPIPGTHLAPPTCRYRARTRCYWLLEHAHMAVLGTAKEILGV